MSCATVEPADVDRIFSHSSNRPACGWRTFLRRGWPGATSLAEVTRWLQEQKQPIRCFFIKNQAEWKKHLQVDRLIDLEMLKMQVGFSAQEGGFDAFIHENESEFIHRFFS